MICRSGKMIQRRRSVSLSFCLLAVAMATILPPCDAQRNSEENLIEIKTEPPPPPRPSPSVASSHRSQDCNEYEHGILQGIRRHGSTWQNSESDCSNCTCDNGDIRCFFHFCNGPPTGYMTPPSSLKNGLFSPPSEKESSDSDFSPATTSPEDLLLQEFFEEEEEEEESSGFLPPRDDDTEDGEDPLWPFLTGEDLFEVPTQPPVASLGAPPTDANPSFDPQEGKAKPKLSRVPLQRGTKEGSAPGENLLQEENNFCGKSCNKVCPKGFKVDGRTGCLKCRCRRRCPLRLRCSKICPLGYLKDAYGCRKCACLLPPPTPSDSDITFEDENLDSPAVPNRDRDDALLPPLPLPHFLPEEDLHLLTDDEDEDEEKEYRPRYSSGIHFPSRDADIMDVHERRMDEEPCNTTTRSPPGCLDGSRHLSVGDVWHRGPCVACRCVAMGYSECNITYCPDLKGCPRALIFLPPRTCCPICREAPYADSPNLDSDNFDRQYLPQSVPINSDKSGKSDSFLTTGYRDEASPGAKENQGHTDDTIYKSVYTADRSAMLLILVPTSIIFTVTFLIFVHFWRRHHRDKYDINSYRAEEKEVLHPVKALPEEQTSLKHV